MSEDSQLPAVRPEFRLDVATREQLKEAEFDPRILEAVETLGNVGINFARDATPGYVRAKLFQRSEGLREAQQAWVDLARETRKELKAAKRAAQKIADDPERAKDLEKLESKIAKLTSDLLGYDSMQAKLNAEANENDETILKLDDKIKRPAFTDGDGNRSWDPDAPASVHVNVAPGSNVSIHEK